MLLCKQEEAGVQLNAEQADWKDDTDDETDDQMEAQYMYMSQLQCWYSRSSRQFWKPQSLMKCQLHNGDTNHYDSSDICYYRAQDDQELKDDLDQELI
ncbi:hypothetical protein Tco_0084785 [Tanacetum coccineum]